jgi:peptide/nickel transport system substrate-binding protein
MRKFYKWLPFVIALVLVFTSTGVNTQAQDSGGVVIEGNFGGDPKNFNPLILNDTASQRVAGFLFPSLINVDPKTGNWMPGAPGGLTEKWDISEDGLTYTFHLRKNAYKWSDGKPVTAKDYKFAYDAVVSGKVNSALTGQTQERIASVEAPDDWTVVVKFKDASCTALSDVGFITVVPAHVFAPDFSDMNDHAFNLNPTVTAGVFNFKEMRPAEQVTLVANPNYPDAEQGKVKPEGFIYKVVPDQTVLVEQFLAGETNVIDTPPVARREDLRKAQSAGTAQVYNFPGNSWDYVGWNIADPGNPTSAVDEKLNPTNADQGHHPLFGDVRVRRAMAFATNVDQIIKTAVFGEGTRMASSMIPASWAYDPNLKTIPYDPEQAKKLLDEAGFPMGPDGIRIAKGAMYAKDGAPFQFTLYTNEGNSRRKAIGTIMQDNLKQIGVQVDFQTIDFNTLLDKMNAQDYDAFILGWRNGFPDDPDQTNIFTPLGDVVGSGNNTSSYDNPEVTKLMAEALRVPGCDTAARAAIYHKIQKILQDDQPYMFLFVQNGMYAASSTVEGFSPLPSQLYWNVDTWTVRSK